MSKIDNAFEQVIGLAEKFKAILDVADEVKKIGSLEQATEERKKALAKASDEYRVLQSKMDSATAELEAVMADRQAALADQKNECEKLLQEARMTREEILTKTKDEAASMMDTTKAEIDAAWREHNMRVSTVIADVDNQRAALARIKEELADLTAQRDAVTEQLEALRASARSILA